MNDNPTTAQPDSANGAAPSGALELLRRAISLLDGEGNTQAAVHVDHAIAILEGRPAD